jgi:peptidoglycan-associated lipoprotein
MFSRFLVSASLAFVTVAMLHQSPAAKAQERMQLGVPIPTPASEFRDLAGDRVFFGDGSADLGTRAKAALAAQAKWLLRNAAQSVIVEGHADDTGDTQQNLLVSRMRAEAVRQRLIELGVAAERIRTVAYGRLRLLADCPDLLCAAQNRRAITVIGRPTAEVWPSDSRRPERTRDGDAPRPARRLF